MCKPVHCSLLSLTSQPFSKRFVDNIHLMVDRIGAYDGMGWSRLQPTNQSEAYNYVLKRLQDWKEAPIDAIVLSLFRLSQFNLVEIKRGRCGQGDYNLRVS